MDYNILHLILFQKNKNRHMILMTCHVTISQVLENIDPAVYYAAN